MLSNSRASDNQRNFSCLSGQAYNLELHNKFPKRFLFFFAVSISYHFTCSINYYSFCFCCRKNEIVKQLFVFPQERIAVVFFFNEFYLKNELFVLVYISYDICSTTYFQVPNHCPKTNWIHKQQSFSNTWLLKTRRSKYVACLLQFVVFNPKAIWILSR